MRQPSLSRGLMFAAALLPLLVASACADGPAAPRASLIGAKSANFAKVGAGSACAANPSVVVSDEASLDAAAAAAQPGTVIAIDGVVRIHAGVTIPGADVTLTCAAPGSGLSFASDASDVALVYPSGDRDAIQGLTLDGTGGVYAIYAVLIDGSRTQFNKITCGDSCGFWAGTTNANISDNVIVQPHNGASGLHLQSLRASNQDILHTIDGTRIERNTLTATTPTGARGFGALRPRDGTGITVADNVIAGPWSNGISSVNVNGSDFARNVITGPSQFGIAINLVGASNLAPASNNVFTANRVTDVGVAGFSLNNACFNVFHGSTSHGTTPTAFVLSISTGGNVVDGTAGTSIDDGSFDCDGDGRIDPNRVSGDVSRALIATHGTLTADIQAGARTGGPISAKARLITQ